MVTAMLMPGMDGTGDLFEPLLDSLPAGCEPRIVRYPTDTFLGYSELEASMELPKGDFVIVAESFSGPLAIRLAAKRPPNLRALVLVATFARSPWPNVPKWMRWLARPALFAFAPPAIAIRAALLDAAAPIHLARAVARAVKKVAPEVMAKRVRAILTVDVREELAAVAAPLLCLRGRHDRLVGRSAMADFRNLKPDAAYAQISGPHLLLQREPSASARAITRFFEEQRVL